ncbi:hypothetical protein VTK56DRAFT_7780 [Thermocarpiscus australiensis]
MAPPQQFLRTATQTRRSARAGFPEPDDFEGLPVRQWRQEWVSAAPSLQQEMAQQSDRWAIELSYGMPRESHLLPPHSQELLRAARSGRLYKRPAPEEEEGDADVEAVKGEKKEWEPPSDGFMVKMWKQVPRNAETPTTSYLAKRHKNTVTLTSRAATPQSTGPTVIRATVRRMDAAGNPYEQTITLTEGQHVDGEIISKTVVPAPSAVQGELGFQQTAPARRRPPPPKRKAKGLRGRRKGRLPLPLPATRSHPSRAGGASSVKTEAVGADGVQVEDTEDSANQDSEMADVSGMPSEDEEGDGGEGEEGDDGEEEGGYDEGGETPDFGSTNGEAQGQETEASETSDLIQPISVEEPDQSLHATSEEDVATPKARSQPPSLAPLGPPHNAMAKFEGSPLKNVMIQSPTETAAATSLSTSSYLEVQSRTSSMEIGSGNTVHQAYASGTMMQGLSEPAGQGSLFQPAQNPAESTETAWPVEGQAEPGAAVEPVPPPGTETSDSISQAPGAASQQNPDVSLRPPASPALLPTAAAAAEDEDDGLNLLGSLERELDRQQGMSNASRGATPPPPTVAAAAFASADADADGPASSTDGHAP